LTACCGCLADAATSSRDESLGPRPPGARADLAVSFKRHDLGRCVQNGPYCRMESQERGCKRVPRSASNRQTSRSVKRRGHDLRTSIAELDDETMRLVIVEHWNRIGVDGCAVEFG
jgi:hypothetical protein